ncbi:Aminopeptidase-domain protein [Streptomyces clavuligerus]|uniref:Aminopeptidase-domain protein n=1 Tax=Streptomyces clavuligerus TaxID=1901 RepID=E2Q2L4_STRCL|nr:Aminopeptidase-domain protein [Streptomyces clavuligerus]
MTGAGEEMHALVERLYPLCRSITGDGVRATLDIVGEHLPLQVHEVPTGTPVLDWTVPQEWNIKDAYIADPTGKRVVDFAASSLHVLGYSVPVSATLSLDELRGHLHTLPDHPSWVPYRTSYYRPQWGFCLAQETLDALPDGDYEVRIDSTLADGHLTYAEHVVPGQVTDEVLISCHVCHPSLANDNLAGIAVATWLAGALAEGTPWYTYRFLFAPGTIGAITWLARNPERVGGALPAPAGPETGGRVAHGLVLACAGDPGRLTYKQSRRGDAEIDRVMRYVLAASDRPHRITEFTPYGYDERQFCSPGFDLGVGSLSRTPYAGYPEYHTSADNPDFVTPEALADTLAVCREACAVLDRNRRYRNLSPYGEPQLGRRGLYDSLGGRSDAQQAQMAMLWVLSLSDGGHSLLDVAERSGLPFDAVTAAADALHTAGLITA